ncbi:MAG: ABC transporter permease [Methanobacterium sp.]|uniref:ABC transporter permease n=1 Tax=Methanobacterium sp. TaxID=2164 RepID=UPI003D64C83D|nr:ABC transporter permease [Methanobacterium sp.]
MKVLALAKKEAQDILTNKIYIMVVFVQIFIIIGAFGLGIASSVITDPTLLDKYGATSSLKVGISEDLTNSNIVTDLKAQNLNLIYFNDIKDANALLGSELVAVIQVSPPPNEDIVFQSDTSNAFYPIVSQKINAAVNKFRLEKKLQSAGLNPDQIQKIQNPVILNEIKVNENNQPRLTVNNSYFVEIMYGFIVPFVLLLPFFLASNIVTDSIVGEKERKTFEMILMTPLPSSMVIIGKILPILSFSMIQSIAWIILLDILGVPIFNSFILIFILFFVGLGFIGIGILISMIVDSTKEANSAITLALMFATFLLFIPLFIKIQYFGGILDVIPTVLMVKLSSTPNISLETLLFLIPTVLISILIFGLTVNYFRHERAIRL